MVVLVNVIKPQGLEPLQFPTKFRSPSALDAAVSGAADIDRFTLTTCQTDRGSGVIGESTKLQSSLGAWLAVQMARVGNCSDVLRMVRRE